MTDAVTASLGFTSHRFVVRVVPTDLQTYDGVDAPLHGARGAHETVAAAVIKADAPPDASATGPGADLRANINKLRADPSELRAEPSAFHDDGADGCARSVYYSSDADVRTLRHTSTNSRLCPGDVGTHRL